MLSGPSTLSSRISRLINFTVLQHPEKEFLLRASYLEIYNETLKDLLAPEAGALKIRQDEQVRLSASFQLTSAHFSSIN